MRKEGMRDKQAVIHKEQDRQGHRRTDMQRDRETYIDM